MRITSFAIFNQITRSINNNLRSMSRFTNMLSTGKKINKPSDDVSGMINALDYKVSLNQIQQYKRNIAEAETYLGFADAAMVSVTDLITRAKELTVLGSSTTTVDKDKYAAEIAQLRDQMLSLSNTKVRNKYIFSGYKTDTASFGPGPGFTYQGDSGEINIAIDSNATIAVNIPGEQAFGSGGITFMETLDNLYNTLMNQSSSPTDISAFLDEFENALDQIANIRADIGGRLNHLDNRKTNLDDRDITLKTYLSEIEDTDLAETITEISKTEVALQSLRQSSAEVLSQSLLDFIR